MYYGSCHCGWRRIWWGLGQFIRENKLTILLYYFIAIAGLCIGLLLGSTNIAIQKNIVYEIFTGCYSYVGTYFQITALAFVTFLIIILVGFCKFFNLLYAVIMLFWGLKFGADIINISMQPYGIPAVIFFYAPYYVLVITCFIFLIAYVNAIFPPPRLYWFSWDRYVFNCCFLRLLWVFIPFACIGFILFILIPLFISMFIIVI